MPGDALMQLEKDMMSRFMGSISVRNIAETIDQTDSTVGKIFKYYATVTCAETFTS